MGVAEKERKWARRVSELENLWGCEGVGGEGSACAWAQHITKEHTFSALA